MTTSMTTSERKSDRLLNRYFILVYVAAPLESANDVIARSFMPRRGLKSSSLSRSLDLGRDDGCLHGNAEYGEAQMGLYDQGPPLRMKLRLTNRRRSFSRRDSISGHQTHTGARLSWTRSPAAASNIIPVCPCGHDGVNAAVGLPLLLTLHDTFGYVSLARSHEPRHARHSDIDLRPKGDH